MDATFPSPDQDLGRPAHEAAALIGGDAFVDNGSRLEHLGGDARGLVAPLGFERHANLAFQSGRPPAFGDPSAVRLGLASTEARHLDLFLEDLDLVLLPAERSGVSVFEVARVLL